MRNLVVLIALLTILAGCGATSTTYQGLQLQKNANIIVVDVEGAADMEEATQQAIRALKRERFRIDESDESAGYVQTERKEVGGGLQASVEIRLDLAVMDANTVEVTGEYYGTSIISGEDSWKRIEYKGMKGDNERVSWDNMLDVAERIGEVSQFTSDE